jgi:hypothetical protein
LPASGSDYGDCQNNVPIVGRYFDKTAYAAILVFGTLLWQAV